MSLPIYSRTSERDVNNNSYSYDDVADGLAACHAAVLLPEALLIRQRKILDKTDALE